MTSIGAFDRICQFWFINKMSFTNGREYERKYPKLRYEYAFDAIDLVKSNIPSGLEFFSIQIGTIFFYRRTPK